MVDRRRVAYLAAIGALWLGMTGCGDDLPATGEKVRARPDESVKRKAVQRYMEKMKTQRSQAVENNRGIGPAGRPRA